MSLAAVSAKIRGVALHLGRADTGGYWCRTRRTEKTLCSWKPEESTCKKCLKAWRTQKARLTLRESIERMRAIPALWKHLAHPIQEMQRIREDPDYNPWAEPQFAARFAPCCAGCNCQERIAALTS